MASPLNSAFATFSPQILISYANPPIEHRDTDYNSMLTFTGR